VTACHTTERTSSATSRPHPTRPAGRVIHRAIDVSDGLTVCAFSHGDFNCS